MFSPNNGLISLGDLLSKPPEEIKFIVEGLLICGGLGLLAGKPKAGKSTLARVLALSVAQGKPFLNHPSNKGTVLYFGLEEKESEVRRHFEEMGAEGTEQILISTQAIPGKEIETLRDHILRYAPSLVILDPLFHVAKVRDSNNYGEVTNALRPLMTLARETDTHILCVHHLGKGGRPGADAILGSTAIRGAFDINILLNRTNSTCTIESENRYGEDLEQTVLKYDQKTRTACLGEAKKDYDGDRIGDDILSFLDRSSSPKTEPEIADAISGKNQVKRYSLRRLVDSSKLIRSGTGRRGDPFLYSISRTLVPDLSSVQGYENTDVSFAPRTNLNGVEQ